ncbi:PREDICTED: immunoglobulin superfamily member 3 [Aptenodytes forsteri]|uniref:immunoglobulin superfamily member 3 n=1 Tax=Aptenodytes forsteri TaxID=9233 RepID=UPI00090546CA|nr:PREDICTED: immunoglobulin superfamily member 3 [Aptenodytes forsteri]
MGLARCLAAAFLLLHLLLGLSTGQRVVTVQKGPLYRVRGSHVTLWCKVSGYQGPAEQNFQWSIYLPSAPEREVQIVSTVDPSFPYAIYTQRVRSRGIYVERVQGDAVLLHITDLQDRDAGEYECHTPNTDERYFGSYSAKMNLVVIADTLSASMVPQVLTRTEGDTVELTCEVSKSTAQHTHLSVGWYRLQGAGERRAEEVLTLSKDFVLRPGPSYMQRFLAGDVRLNKVGNTTYKLSIGGAEPSDQGQLYCEAAEWIEDPDETWKDISRKQTGRTSLAVMSQGRDLSVDIAAAETSLSEGDTLQLNCMVGAQRSSSRHFQVLWLLNSVEVARVDPHGVLIWEDEYEERAKLGQLRAFKQSNVVYVLTIYEVELKDNGTYHCSVSEVKTPGDFHSIQTNFSSGIQVDVKPIGLGLHAMLRSRIATVRYGQSFELDCQVNASYTLKEVPVSVGWLFQPSPPTGHYHELVRVLPSGTVAWGTAQPHFQGKAQLTKAATSFRLRIHNAMAADKGTYQCEVEVWRRNTLTLGQPAATARSNAVGIKVVLPESKLQVSTKESSVEIAGGAESAIECKIMFAQNNSQFTVTWYLLPPPPADANPLKIIRAHYSSILEYGAEFSSPAQKSRFLSQRVSSNIFWLRILSANPRDQGRYYCVVEEWLWLVDGWYKLREGASGRTTLEFKLPEHKLHLEKTNSSISVREGEEVTLHCLLRGTHLPTAHLSATWFRGEESGRTRPLLILHCDGAIEYPQESLVGRLHLRRPTASDFSLTLRSVEKGDAGVYHCQVQEWQQQTQGKDRALEAWAHSGYIWLTTIPPESTVFSRICSSPPLLNFILYLPLVLILLLALAGFCWFFKFRKSKRGSVTGDQLMELQGAGEVRKT